MQFDVITLFPDMFTAITKFGITQRAFKKKQCTLSTWNPRNFTTDHYHTVDHKPYGGGAGMIMLAQPLKISIQAAQARQINLGLPRPYVIYLSPQGKLLTHQQVIKLAQHQGIILLCGRYEAIDQRLLDHYVDEEFSLGDFVLSGGELPAMALMDAIIRQLPDVLHNKTSITEESFTNGLLDYPHYTRPQIYEGIPVPPILLGGHHAHIKQWRRERALETTIKKRPDLITQARQDALLNIADEQFIQTLKI